MINALYIIQEAVNYHKQQCAAESPEQLQLVLQYAGEHTLAEMNNLYRQYIAHHLAEHAVRHCHRVLTSLHDTLYDEQPTDPVLLDGLATMIAQYELVYESHLQYACTLSRYAENELRRAVLSRLDKVLPRLRKKNIPVVYLAELSSGINSLFSRGKLPELKFNHQHYLLVFLTALEELAADQRKKDWTARFLYILINYNFNYMGVFNRWCETIQQNLDNISPYAGKEKYLQQQAERLNNPIPDPPYAYDPLRRPLAEYMSNYIQHTREDIHRQQEDDSSSLAAFMLSSLNADEMCVIFHAAFHADFFRHSTKRDAAKAFSTYIRSKTDRKISYKTLEKFDKPALELAAYSSRKKVKLMLEFIEKTFKF